MFFSPLHASGTRRTSRVSVWGQAIRRFLNVHKAPVSTVVPLSRAHGHAPSGWLGRLIRMGMPGMLLLAVHAAQPLPPAPTRYVTDTAGVLSVATVEALNAELEQFERKTSSQLVVYVAKSLPPGEELNGYVNRLFAAWKIGQRGKDNGILLAVFTQDRKLRIETGYGLEGAIPDITAGRIINAEMTPLFRSGDYDGGVRQGVQALMAAARGEYQGTGRTAADGSLPMRSIPSRLAWPLVLISALAGLIIRWISTPAGPLKWLLVLSGLPVGGIGIPLSILLGLAVALPAGVVAGLITLALLGAGRSHGTQYARGGRRPLWTYGTGSFGGSGGWSGGFSGGGGRSGGGGASGSW